MTNPKKLPKTRDAVTKKFSIPFIDDEGRPGNLRFYLTTGTYEDGTLGEIFIRADKAGSFISGTLDMFAIVLSIGLQYGVPLKVILDKMRGTKFPPCGFLGDKEFKSCSSPFDLIAQYLSARFLSKEPDDK